MYTILFYMYIVYVIPLDYLSPDPFVYIFIVSSYHTFLRIRWNIKSCRSASYNVYIIKYIDEKLLFSYQDYRRLLWNHLVINRKNKFKFCKMLEIHKEWCSASLRQPDPPWYLVFNLPRTSRERNNFNSLAYLDHIIFICLVLSWVIF